MLNYNREKSLQTKQFLQEEYEQAKLPFESTILRLTKVKINVNFSI